jgi:AraC-like DNA-binding protein
LHDPVGGVGPALALWFTRSIEKLAELRALIARHGAGGLTQTPLAGVSVMAAYEPTLPLGSIAEPSLAVMAGGAKRTVVGDRRFIYEAGEYVVVSLDLPVTAHVLRASRDEPFLAFGLVLRPATIATLLLEAPRASGNRTPSGIVVSQASPELLDAIVRMTRLLDHPEDAPALAPAYEREILWRLIAGEHGTTVRQIGLADSALSHISKAIAWIRAHHDQRLRIDDLADLSGMSPSTFHRHFRAATAMTPIQFQKNVRLQEARALLIARPDDIAGAGFAVGYNSPSQFSREYARRYGRPPGKDAERLRAS